MSNTFLKKVNTYKTGTLFALPFLVLYTVFVLAPIVVAIVISLTDYNMLEAPSFVGLENYKMLFMDSASHRSRNVLH